MAAVPLRRNRDFVLLQAGQFLSSAGSQATAIAYPLLVLALTHSAVKAGLVSFARTAPIAVLAIPAGLAADHWNRRALMIGADVLRAGAMTGLAVGLVVGDVPFWAITCVAFVEGVGATVFNAAEPGALRAIVPTEQLPEAAGAQSGRTAAVRIVGPPLGGALFEAGRALPFLVDACSYACSTISLLLMRAQFQEERELEAGHGEPACTRGPPFTWDQPFLRTTAFLYGLLNFTALGLLFCIVVIGEAEGLPGGEIGLLTGVFAASVVVGSFVSRVIRRSLSVHAVLILEVWAWLGCAVFLVWPRAVVLGARADPGRTGGALDGLCRERLSHRRHAGSPARPRRVRSQCDRPVRRVAGTAGRRVPPAALDAPLDGGILHRLGSRTGPLGDGEWSVASPSTAGATNVRPVTLRGPRCRLRRVLPGWANSVGLPCPRPRSSAMPPTSLPSG